MQGLLGKINKITPLEPDGGHPGMTRLRVDFKSACVLPARTAVPEWLADQTLTVERTVTDAREVGRPGDSLVLTAGEAARWLTPFSVSPAVSRGVVPPTVQLTLRWWKDEKAPDYTVRANGRQQTGQFSRAGEGADWTAAVETAALFDTPPVLPIVLEFTCDKLTVSSAVLPEAAPCHVRMTRAEGPAHLLENDWYELTLIGAQAGAIQSLREKGRGVDHFRHPEGLIQPPLLHGGHSDRLRRGWNDEVMAEDGAQSAGARREGGMTRLTLEAIVDEGQNLRTTAGYALPDDWPLVLLQREFSLGKPKEDDGKDKKPKEPINDMQPVGLGFRAAWMAERDGAAGSRLLCADGDRLVSTRAARTDESHRFDRWRMTGGWGMVEHPRRREYMLYLCDPQTPPYLATWNSPYSLTMEPIWEHMTLRPGGTTGFALAMTAGERAGAGAAGAWVACRTAPASGGVRCALIGRLLADVSEAAFTVGTDEQTAPVQRLWLPGVGTVAGAVADFPRGSLDGPFTAEVAGLPARRDP